MNDLIIVKARVKILTESEGGNRQTPIATGYRPNHVFDHTTDGKIITGIGDFVFDGFEYLYPGDEKEITIRFLQHPFTDKYIYAGRKWRIQEGSRFIGEAEILEVVS